MSSKGILRSIIVIALIAALIFIKIKFFPPVETKSAGKPTQNKELPVSAKITVPRRMDNHIPSVGSVMANEEVELKSEISGKITRIFFTEGAQVKKGELLIKINDSELQAQLKKSEFQKKLAEEKEFRQKKLLEAGGISQEEYDGSLNQLNTFNADIDLIKAQLDKTEIKAPFGGVVGIRYVSEGSYISSATRIASIQDIDPIKLEFSIPEKYISIVKKGDMISFTNQGRKEKYKGAIYAIEPKIDLGTRTVILRALCPNKDGKIFPGAFAKIELELKESENVLMIPTQALIPELKGQKVFLFKNGKAISQKVETGLRTDTEIEITNGLQPGDTVITTGIMQLKTGAAVKIIDFN